MEPRLGLADQSQQNIEKISKPPIILINLLILLEGM
jgi:hypothetical protein